ncbi:MAG: hypothetical protein K0S04_3359 [Herbinix sp.]|jgi:hypothetical protein|nr:hypothetical protein [Herbinix sp.]
MKKDEKILIHGKESCLLIHLFHIVIKNRIKK